MGLLSYLLGILDGLAQITILSLISVRILGIANQLNKVLLDLSQMDILPYIDIDDKFLDFDDWEEEPLNDQFAFFGLENTNSLRNMGSTYIYLMISGLYLNFLMIIELMTLSSRPR